MLKGKKIILCVTGSIAAYKAVYLLRLLVKEGADVRVIMTDDATKFVSALTFSTLSGHEAMIHLSTNDQWQNHVLLGRWADLILIAPATAQTVAKMANGFCDSLLLAVYLSATCPVMIAPAMDEDMWQHVSVRRNIEKLVDDGVGLVDVEEGDLASGLSGLGRLAEPELIFQAVVDRLTGKRYANKTVLITAGPTIEPIDPVRYISNHSTGKMGVALARAFAADGAAVTLVLGPSAEKAGGNVKTIPVQTAAEMFDRTMQAFPQSDVVVMAAAVADFTPQHMTTQKIKKQNKDFQLSLKPTRDILAEAGEQKKPGQILVGFALETENEKDNALAKLQKKRADFMILNSADRAGTGFGGDTNQVTILGKDGTDVSLPLKSKREVAHDIVDFLSKYL